MGIKFAMDIIKEIEKRGSITVPSGYVTGEAFEEWLYEDITMDSKVERSLKTTIIKVDWYENVYLENYGDAA